MKRWMVWMLTVGLCLSLCACANDSSSAVALLSEEMQKASPLPAGEIYRSGVEAGESGYFSPSLIATMYGETAEERCFSLMEEYAVYLTSFAEPCEIAVFRCYARSDADRIAEMCLSRVESLRILLAGTAFRERVDRASVRVDGRLVVMCVLP